MRPAHAAASGRLFGSHMRLSTSGHVTMAISAMVVLLALIDARSPTRPGLSVSYQVRPP